MKKVSYILSAFMLISAPAFSLECSSTAPTCDELGYKQTEADCSGERSILRCPFDLSAVQCSCLEDELFYNGVCGFHCNDGEFWDSTNNACATSGKYYYLETNKKGIKTVALNKLIRSPSMLNTASLTGAWKEQTIAANCSSEDELTEAEAKRLYTKFPTLAKTLFGQTDRDDCLVTSDGLYNVASKAVVTLPATQKVYCNFLCIKYF